MKHCQEHGDECIFDGICVKCLLRAANNAIKFAERMRILVGRYLTDYSEEARIIINELNAVMEKEDMMRDVRVSKDECKNLSDFHSIYMR